MSSSAGGLVAVVAPGDVFVVGGMAGQAAVEDAGEAVAEGVQGLVVGVAGGAAVVVAGPGAGAGGERGEGPQVDGVGEALVAGVAGQDGPAGARGPGDR